MKKYFITVLVFLATTAAFAQNRRSRNSNPPPTQAQDTTSALTKALKNATPPPPPPKAVKPGKKDWSKVILDKKRPQDHFMFELAYDNWAGATDSMSIKGANHSENFYFMYAWPFKSDARLSVAAGIGIGSSNIYFNQVQPQVVNINNSNQTLAFPSEAGNNHFKRFKLTTNYLEFPVELRFAADPEHMDHSWKFSVGTKIGLLLAAYTKGKTLLSPQGAVIGNYTEKESSKAFFNTFELTPVIRVSKGIFGVFGQIHANSLIKASAGPTILPWSAGIVISGL
jgi:hypothetical protein